MLAFILIVIYIRTALISCSIQDIEELDFYSCRFVRFLVVSNCFLRFLLYSLLSLLVFYGNVTIVLYVSLSPIVFVSFVFSFLLKRICRFCARKGISFSSLLNHHQPHSIFYIPHIYIYIYIFPFTSMSILVDSHWFHFLYIFYFVYRLLSTFLDFHGRDWNFENV